MKYYSWIIFTGSGNVKEAAQQFWQLLQVLALSAPCLFLEKVFEELFPHKKLTFS